MNPIAILTESILEDAKIHWYFAPMVDIAVEFMADKFGPITTIFISTMMDGFGIRVHVSVGNQYKGHMYCLSNGTIHRIMPEKAIFQLWPFPETGFIPFSPIIS